MDIECFHGDVESIYRILSIRDIKWILHVSPGEENKSGLNIEMD